jgi:hypothetical protein
LISLFSNFFKKLFYYLSFYLNFFFIQGESKLTAQTQQSMLELQGVRSLLHRAEIENQELQLRVNTLGEVAAETQQSLLELERVRGLLRRAETEKEELQVRVDTLGEQLSLSKAQLAKMGQSPPSSVKAAYSTPVKQSPSKIFHLDPSIINEADEAPNAMLAISTIISNLGPSPSLETCVSSPSQDAAVVIAPAPTTQQQCDVATDQGAAFGFAEFCVLSSLFYCS